MKRLFTVFASLLTQGAKEQKTKMMYVVMALVMMVLAPSTVMGATTTINFKDAAYAAFNAARFPNQSGRYYANIVMSDQYYDAIGNGAKVGDVIHSKNANTLPDVDISRLAFIFNTSGAGNAHNGNNGFYLRMESGKGQGLYTGNQASKLAILNLKPGDKVTINFAASSNVQSYGAGINWQNYGWKGSDETVTINRIGDLIVEVNQGTIIQTITIDTEVAEYDISTSADGKTSTFVFTKDGLLDNNDFTLPNLSASFGSIYDFLVVQNYESHMYKTDGTENLTTDPTHNYQPSAGSFYCFKPTAGGTIKIEGSLQGSVMHLFVYDPTAGANGTGDWVGRNGNIFYDTFTGGTYEFTVTKGLIYYICQNNLAESGNAFHLNKFTFTTTYYVQDLGVIINDVDDYSGEGHPIQLTKTEGLGGYELKVKRCSANIKPSSLTAVINQYGWIYMSKPEFEEGTDHAGTVIWDLHADNGDDAIVVTFPYHADYSPEGYVDPTDPDRSYGHTWNFIDPRNSDSNIGNCLIRSGLASFNTGITEGILSIGQDKNTSSQFHKEVLNREWTYSQRQTGQSGGFHDPYYANVWEMEGDNADMIWETEGLWFDTGTNLSCIHNENDAVEDPFKTNPLNFTSPGTTDPDRYVGLLPVTDGKKSSFTIPGLKPGDRVLIFMKSGEGSGDNGIFLNITGAKDALGKQIEATDLYKAGGTNWQHDRYEGCYHFIKDDTKDPNSDYGRITFDMQAGSMCKLLYIRIYTGQRIPTNNIVAQNSTENDDSKLLFINDKGATTGSGATSLSLRFRGKGQQQKARVLTSSGNLNYSTLELKKDDSNIDSHFTVAGAYSQAVTFTSQVGEIGMFRLRETDVEYNEKYVADFSDRNFTVGYRDKVDSYPYTWDFTDIKGFSSTALSNEATKYPIAEASQDEYGNQWDISLFDANGYMKLNTGFDPEGNNHIFDAHRIGFGNQLWADDGAIPETRGLWFYSDDNYTLYNDCLQITSGGISFCNTADVDGHMPWWNYKMVVPDVPNNAAVYLRMKRDSRVADTDKMYSDVSEKNVLFLNTRFHFGTSSDTNPKTSLTEDTQDVYLTQENGTAYSFYKVPGTDDEYILAVKNTTGSTDHLTFTLNGWIVEKVAVSKDDKTLNKKGYASESRNRVIDHSLTSFFTGKPIKAYTAESYDAAASTIGLVEITKPMPAATTTAGQNVGSVLYNSDCADADDEDCGKVLDNKFNLFVPDMHDYKGDPNYPLGNPNITNSDMSSHAGELQSTTNNLMLSYNTGATSNATIPQKINDSSVYVLSYQYFEHDKDNLTENDINEAQVEAFYRVAKNGAGIKPNSAYLILPVTSSPAKVSFLFGDELFGEVNNGIATGITDALELDNGKLEWYSLDGRKLNGAPTEKGLYIINGKKVLVK